MLSSKTSTSSSESLRSKTSAATSRDSKLLAKVSTKSESKESARSESKPSAKSQSKPSAKSESESSISNKSSPATPKDAKLAKVSRKSDSKSSSTLQKSSLSIDRSPRTDALKPAADKRSPKIPTPPEKKQQHSKGSEVQTKLSLFQEDLKKVKEQLAYLEKEKTQALAELLETKRLADEANDKLNEALNAQKQAEESIEVEKSRADELEHVRIKAAQKREEERQKELETILNQHAMDVSALLSTNQELQRVKHDLSEAYDAKDTAVTQDEDAIKIAQTSTEKVELLSGEVSQLKAMLDSELETESSDVAKLVKQLKYEVDSLRQELERAKTAEEKLSERESMVEVLKTEVGNANQVATYAAKFVDDWKKKAELLEIRAEEATRSERLASGSLLSMMKKLEQSNILLQGAEFEITSLRCSIDSLEISLRRHKADIRESYQHLEISKQEAIEMVRDVEDLKSEIQRTKEEKMQAMDNETLAALTVQSLLEEKNRLINELEASRDEEKRSRKAMESLESAFHEVTLEVRNAEETLSANQTELGFALSQIDDLKMVLKATEDNYEAMLNKSKEEIALLEKLVERSQVEAKSLKAALDEKELEFNTAIQKSEEEIVAVKVGMGSLAENSKAEWDEKEFVFVDAMKRSEEEITSIKSETSRLAGLIEEAEEKACAAKEDGSQLLNTLKKVEFETNSAKELADKAKAENLQLQERLLDKENKLQCITQENNDRRIREAAALKKAEKLSKLLEETKMTEENSKLSSSEKEYDLLPKMMEHVGEDGEKSAKFKLDLFLKHLKEHGGKDPSVDVDQLKGQNGNGDYEAGSLDCNMWDNSKIVEDIPFEKVPEPESFEEELDSKIDRVNQINWSSETLKNIGDPPLKQQQQKKKPLLHKFGGLLKKKGNPK